MTDGFTMNCVVRTTLQVAASGLFCAGVVHAGAESCARGPATSFDPRFTSDSFFSAGDSRLDESSSAKLVDLVRKTQSRRNEVIILLGHSDATELDAKTLSRLRAESVKKHLTDLGVPPSMVYTEGKGATQPVAPPGSAYNRRVELEHVGTAWRLLADGRIHGLNWMRMWLQPEPAQGTSSAVTIASPLAHLPQVKKPGQRAAFVEKLLLAAIFQKDDRTLAAALPSRTHAWNKRAERVCDPDDCDAPPVSLYAQALGTPMARAIFSREGLHNPGTHRPM